MHTRIRCKCCALALININMKTRTFITVIGTLCAGALFTACTNEVEEAMNNLQTFGLFSPSSSDGSKKADEVKLHYQLYKEGKETLADYPYLPVFIQLAQEADKEIPVSILKELLENGMDVNAKASDGQTALVRALQTSSPSESLVDFLLQHGADPNIGEPAPLYLSMDMGEEKSLAFMKKLVAAGAKVTPAKPGDVTSPLIAAASRNMSTEAIRFLIDAGADVNYVADGGRTALMAAEDSTCSPALRALLISSGADVNRANNEGYTAAFYAAQFSGAEAIQAYLDAGVDLLHKDGKGMTLEICLRNALMSNGQNLLQAAQNDVVDKLRHMTFEQMLAKGASSKTEALDNVVRAYIKAESFKVVTEAALKIGDDFMNHYLAFQRGEESIKDYPLMANLLNLAMERGQIALPEEIQAFLDAGATVDMAYNKHSALCYAVQGKNEKVAQLLVEKGANVHGVPEDENVEHPLWLAGWSGNENLGKYLVRHGANPDALVNNEPLVMLAYRRNSPDIVRVLWAAGAKANVKVKGMDMLLSFMGSDDLKQYVPELLDHGANANATVEVDGQDLAVLMFAIYRKDLPMVKALVEHGADVNFQTVPDLYTPLMVAAALGEEGIMKYLVKSGANVDLKSRDGETVQSIIKARQGREFLNAYLNAVEESSTNPEDRAAAKAVRGLIGN